MSPSFVKPRSTELAVSFEDLLLRELPSRLFMLFELLFYLHHACHSSSKSFTIPTFQINPIKVNLVGTESNILLQQQTIAINI